MIGVVILLGYVVAGSICAIAGTRWAQNQFPDQHSSSDLVMNGIMGLCVGAVWPLAVAGWLITKAAGKTPAVRKAELDEREKHIAELEKELGIKRA